MTDEKKEANPFAAIAKKMERLAASEEHKLAATAHDETAAQRKQREVDAWRHREEAERQGRKREQADRIRKYRDGKIADGMVEIRMDKGFRMSRDYFDDFITHQIPELNFNQVKNLHTASVRMACEVAKERQIKKNRVLFVLDYAQRVESGLVRTWVTPAEAAQVPHLRLQKRSQYSDMLEYDEAGADEGQPRYDGGASEHWQKKQRD